MRPVPHTMVTNESKTMSESFGILQPQSKRPHVVIIGGGFAGIAAVKALRHCEADVTVIDRRNHHIFQPLLYQVATAVLAPADVAAPIRQLSARQKNVSVLLAEVIGVDLASRTVEIKYPGAGDKKVAFDYLVVAAGVQSSYFGHNEFAKYAPCLKTITDAQSIRSRI
jgi:NADH:ubiquinone reductase (H+-translocating)